MDEPGNAKREFPKEFHETRLSWLSCIGNLDDRLSKMSQADRRLFACDLARISLGLFDFHQIK